MTAERYVNNFIIFTASFGHLLNQENLYKLYPAEYHDYFLYGPVFAILIYPFKAFPLLFGKILWVTFNFIIYWFAVKKFFKSEVKALFWWILICFQDIYLSGLSFEINNLMIASIILAFCLLEDKKEFVAGLVIGFFSMVKLFPIMALLFISFEIDRKKYLIGIGLGIFLAILIPTTFTNIEFIQSQLMEWVKVLMHKDSLNRNLNPLVDYSLPGLFRKNLGDPSISNLYFILFGFIVLSGLFIKNWMQKNLKLELLVLSILTILVFNSNTESPSFIISSTAVAIWWNFVEKKKTIWSHFFLILYMLFTALPSIDGYPKEFKDQILHQRGLRALPPVIIWFYIVIQSYFKPKIANIL